MKWIVVADAAKARFFNVQNLNDNWSFVKEMSHPESRRNISDMYRDEPNVMSSSFRTGIDVIEPVTDLKEKEEEVFAREVSDFLEVNHHQNKFDELILIAAPSFLGMLRALLDKGVEDKITESINKNLTAMNINELKTRLQQQLD